MDSLTFEDNGEWKLYTEAEKSPITATTSTNASSYKDDHYNVSDILKQRIRCQLSNTS
jgi:hypothetical protein